MNGSTFVSKGLSNKECADENIVTCMPVKANLDRRVAAIESKHTESQQIINTEMQENQNKDNNITKKNISTTPSSSFQSEISVGVGVQEPTSPLSMADMLKTNRKGRLTTNNQTQAPHSNDNHKQQSRLFPSKMQAVIIQSSDGLQIANYLRAMADLVGGKRILFASRMSMGRIGIYLDSKETVDTFISQHGGIEIKDMFLPARRMVTPAERLVLSNVCPSIPHEIIEHSLSTVMRLVSPMNFVALGNKDTDLGHVYSFRRQIFVVRPEGRILPESILVDFEGEKFRIFLSFDEMKCFKCQQPGHLARNCKAPSKASELIQETVMEKNNEHTPPSTTDNTCAVMDSAPTEATPVTTTTTTATTLLPSSSSSKIDTIDMDISLADAMDGEEEEVYESPKDTEEPKKRKRSPVLEKKRPRLTDTQSSGKQTALPTEVLELLDSMTGVITKEAFTQFLGDVKGSDRPLQVAKRFTEDVPGLLAMLSTIQPELRDDRALRERVRRLISNLTKSYEYFEATGDAEDNSITRSNSQESVASLE